MKELVKRCLQWPAGRKPHGKWPEANTKILIALAAEGHSASQIAKMLSTKRHKVTRSAVCGKAFRIGIHIHMPGMGVRPPMKRKEPPRSTAGAVVSYVRDMRPTMPFVKCLADMKFSTFVMTQGMRGDAA